MSALTNLFLVLATLAFCLAIATAVYTRTSKWTNTDPSLRFGLAGLISLASLGTLFLFVGLISTLVIPVVALMVLVAAILAPPQWVKTEFHAANHSFRNNGPRGREWLVVVILKICSIIGLIGVLAPPDTMEWDSLAYHLAVPKLWMQAGHIDYIPFIHHSNFPFAFDNLYLLGLMFGSASAKAFVYAASTFGGFAIFGLARQLYGRQAAWWASIAYISAPVVLWLSGTAYIDVPNGLSAGLGIALAALYIKTHDKTHLWLSAAMLGLATASKYTGLQTIGAVGLILLIVGIRRKQVGPYFKSAVLMGLIAMTIASPWYIKNVVNTSNPVYPFFYSILGGKNWSAPQAATYTHEQLTFGVGVNADTGHHDITQLGHAILGLAYQPGRYINPLQAIGGGNPMGAIGVVALCAMLLWMLSGKARDFELFNLAAIGVSLLLWFYLSQQSRYIVTLTIPLAIMFGGAVIRFRAGPALAAIAALQTAYSVGLVIDQRTTSQLPVAIGTVTPADFTMRHVDFADAADYMNSSIHAPNKVALYDEVFGYLLNCPYYWANPGHSNEIPYGDMRNGQDFANTMRRMGFTHVYIKVATTVRPQDETDAWYSAMGLNGQPQPFPEKMQGKYNLDNFEQRYVPLIADAVARRLLRPVTAFRSGILFEFVDGQ